MIYRIRLITLSNGSNMKKTFFALFLTISLFSMNPAFSQFDDRPPTLGIELTSFEPFQYKDAEGYTIIVGELKNTREFAVTGVKIWAGFYDDVNLQPIDSTIGTTILEVIPANSESYYMIKSPNPNAAITNVSVNLLGFNSAVEKHQALKIEPVSTEITDRFVFSGTIENTAGTDSENTSIHLVFYDAFVPPRIIGIYSTQLDQVLSASSVSFDFDEKRIKQAVGFKVFAESNNFSSNLVDNKIVPQEFISKLITINDVSIYDQQGNRLSDVTVNSPIKIQSNISLQFTTSQFAQEQPYVYYAQVKQSGDKPFVEFLGIFENSFTEEGSQNPNLEWTPEKKGLYFIETFVWDPKGIPLASTGPVILVLVT